MKQSQIDFGNEMLDGFSKKWGTTKEQTASIIRDVQPIKDFYNWPNAEDFLLDTIYGTWEENEKDENVLSEGPERSCVKKLTPTGRRPASAPPSPNAPHRRKK